MQQQSNPAPRPSQPPRRQQTYPDPSSSSQASNPAGAAAGTGTMQTSASMSQVSGRTSSASTRSQRSTNPDKQISQIEKSVTHLLVATKQLLETLTQWSRGQAQEEEVSDVYVRLGYEFNLACRAFNSIGVETNDLGNVPDLLRHILEDTLSQPASPQALDTYLPRIRDIIITLLHGLKRKQSKLRGRGGKESTGSAGGSVRGGGQQVPARNASLASVASNETGITQMLEGVGATQSPARAGSPVLGGGGHSRDASGASNEGDYDWQAANATASGSLSRGSMNRHSMRREQSIPQSDTDSTLSSATAQNIPVQPPFESNVRPPSEVNFPHPPPPPPKQHDALAQLQRGGDLERRASRRFSAYQISKHLGASPNGIPNLPPTQNSPIPNRGRDMRESMTAVRSRTSQYRKNAHQKPDPSPSRSGTIKAPATISEEEPALAPRIDSSTLPKLSPPGEFGEDDSPVTKTPDEYHKPRSPQEQRDALILSATLNGPMSPPDSMLSNNYPTPTDEKPLQELEPQKKAEESVEGDITEAKTRDVATPPPTQLDGLDSSPPQGKELTLFLQYRSKIKKFVLPEGYEELTFARLQLAFIEKFSWNTHETGLELPEIYIQDPVSGVRHELEELSDVKDRSVLVLNVEALDEVKKHFDEGMSGIQKTLDSFKFLIEGQGNLMQRFSDRQLEASKEMARMSAIPSMSTPKPSAPATSKSPAMVSSGASIQEVQTLRRDIAVLRQTYSTMSSDFTSAMTEIRAKAANVKAVAADAAIPTYEGDAGRAHINAGKKQLSSETETIINRVDDLADIVEELRKDVVTRGVRPLPRQLEGVSKEISSTVKELIKLKDFVKREKPVWTKIWEQELKMVMSERDDLTQRDEIIADLDGDLKDVTDIFSLVEEATKQQNLQAGGQPGATPSSGARSSSRNLIAFGEPDMDPHEAKSGMLDEVRALEPNHESRLEAIERAERARQKELQSRKGGLFQQEVESFVEEGKLKKTGGFEEIERLRRVKDQQAQRENWETQERQKAEAEQRRLKRLVEKQAREEAAKAAAVGDVDDGVAGSEEQSAEAGREVDSNDTSQEGDAVFEDAKEERVPSAMSGNVPHSLSQSSLKSDGGGGGGDGPPKLPEIPVDGGEGDGKVPITNNDAAKKANRSSWWQPAVFATT